jgi:hypothetical protein
MPGMRLTPAQVQRLSGFDVSVCNLVLDDLVRAEFLQIGSDGRYARCTEGHALRPSMARADWNVSRSRSTRRAS